ncbi:hypothetical protein [Bdellovibrio bacteriovorus]|uniref:Uncharacterized protein n=1 Tax=Bdellovibrio bacteriovorus str. Tiberius TaxID=1069642 RepID=K7ZCN5_BDEBC|nr:hypothetical protein [Bdellovibrio bacteriovorus]AFY03359.1 Hypothetical protein Bdt_3686 [Bdellovibrio bacteriovorus str. Tiberius]
MKIKQMTVSISIILSSLTTHASPSLSDAPISQDNTVEHQRNRVIQRLEVLFPTADRSMEATRLFSMALIAWNPRLNPNDAERFLSHRVDRMGMMKGLVEPLLTLMDVAHAAGRPEFTRMLNPVLQLVAPGLARNLHDKYQLPLDEPGNDSLNISRMNDLELLNFMKNKLGGSRPHSQENGQDIQANDDFLPNALFGKSSFYGAAIERTRERNDDFRDEPSLNGEYAKDPQAGYSPRNNRGNTSTPGSKANQDEQPRGLFSRMDLMAYSSSCATKCGSDIFSGAASGAGLPGPWFVKVTGVVTGAILGGLSCKDSAECNKDKKKDNTPSEPKEPKNPKEPKEPKQPKEPKDPQEPKAPKEPKEPEEPKEPKDPKEPKESPTNEGYRGRRDDVDKGGTKSPAGKGTDNIRIRLDKEFETKRSIPEINKGNFGRISTPTRRND